MSAKWAKAAAIRAVKTFFQALASYLTVGALVTDVKWKEGLSVAAVAFLYSIVTSLAGLPEVEAND